MLKELKAASNSYVKIANYYNELVEECGYLEFIAINSGIASKQANSYSFIQLSSEIKTMSDNVIKSAQQGRETAFHSLDRVTEAYGNFIRVMRRYRLFRNSNKMNSQLEEYTNLIRVEIENFDIFSLIQDTSTLSRALESLVAQVNIGKTIAIGGKIKAVYIAGNEEKFRIITETMQESINGLLTLLDQISEEFSVIKSLFDNIEEENIL